MCTSATLRSGRRPVCTLEQGGRRPRDCATNETPNRGPVARPSHGGRPRPTPHPRIPQYPRGLRESRITHNGKVAFGAQQERNRNHTHPLHTRMHTHTAAFCTDAKQSIKIGFGVTCHSQSSKLRATVKTPVHRGSALVLVVFHSICYLVGLSTRF